MEFNSNITLSSSDIQKQITLPTCLTLDLAEEIGLHIGDGSMNFYSNKGLYQLRGHIIDDKNHYETQIRELYVKLYNLKINLREMKSTGVIGFQIWSDGIVTFKHNILGLPLGEKGQIKYPLFLNTKDLFFAFLRGLFDTDGSLYFENKRGKPYPRLEIKSTSEPLSLEITKRLNKYGIPATCHKYKRKEKNWNDLYSIVIRGYSSVGKWINLIGSNNKKQKEKMRLVVKPSLKKDGPAVI